jgi:flagellar motility protein MotE (MotC chaperone)
MLISRPYLRLLPITIGAAALMLTVKLGVLWTGWGDGSWDGAPVPVASALAQVSPEAGQAEPVPPAPETAPAAEPAAEGSAASSPASGIAAASPIDPITLNQSEIDLLQALAERREELAQRAREIERREALLAAAEQRIDERITTLKQVQQRLEKLLEIQDEEQAKNLRRLVKVYENMKPKAAARIFEKLEKQVLLRVAGRMKEAKLAPILAQMDPMKVNAVTAELARQRELPLPPGPLAGG